MVSDKQVRGLFKLLAMGKTLRVAAARADMDEKTARKYKKLGKLPSEVKVSHTWRTRPDPFAEVWGEVKSKLEINPGLEAKTLFQYLQRKYPGQFPDGQLRTLQRRVKQWRSLYGPPKEVYFPQIHKPGGLCESDFTHMGSVGVTIQGQPFDHLLYHFVLTYSNWETGSICYSESFESLSEGLQNALWKLGGVPRAHRTDKLSAAVQKPQDDEQFTARYQGLMSHYGMEAQKANTSSPHENGDIEQRHYRFKDAIDQALMLRGSRDFSSTQEYSRFVDKFFEQLNYGRQDRLAEELRVLRPLPERRLESFKRLAVRVGRASTIRVYNNTYSVDSRLIGQKVEIRVYAEHIELWYGQRRIETIPRLRGDGKHRIQYRHIIDWLVRKPGAFENYRYREDLFPTHRFRMAWDWLKQHRGTQSSKEYLKILHLAAKQSETEVDNALRLLIDEGQGISFEAVEGIVLSQEPISSPTDITIEEVDLSSYDVLLSVEGGAYATW
jgi:hypothetical protein